MINALSNVLSRLMQQTCQLGLGFLVGVFVAHLIQAISIYGITKALGDFFFFVVYPQVLMLPIVVISTAIIAAGFLIAGLIDGTRRILVGQEIDQPALWCPDRALNLLGVLVGGLVGISNLVWLLFEWMGRRVDVGLQFGIMFMTGCLAFSISLVIAGQVVRRDVKAS